MAARAAVLAGLVVVLTQGQAGVVAAERVVASSGVSVSAPPEEALSSVDLEAAVSARGVVVVLERPRSSSGEVESFAVDPCGVCEAAAVPVAGYESQGADAVSASAVGAVVVACSV